jgi:mono/diheme cytochrome c family protein
MRKLLAVLALTGLVGGAVTGCDVGIPAGRTPHREFNFLDMVDQPKQKPQRPDLFGAWPTGLLEPPLGAVANGEVPYPFAQAQGDQAGAALRNPLPAAPDVLAHGRFVFENVCIACHGAEGAGDGEVTRLFPKPPSLMTQKVRDWPDGALFHRPMRGQASMPSHARQITQDDAWAVVHYIRSMQSRLPVAPPPAAAVAAGPAGATAGPGGAQP